MDLNCLLIKRHTLLVIHLDPSAANGLPGQALQKIRCHLWAPKSTWAARAAEGGALCTKLWSHVPPRGHMLLCPRSAWWDHPPPHEPRSAPSLQSATAPPAFQALISPQNETRECTSMTPHLPGVRKMPSHIKPHDCLEVDLRRVGLR